MQQSQDAHPKKHYATRLYLIIDFGNPYGLFQQN